MRLKMKIQGTAALNRRLKSFGKEGEAEISKVAMSSAMQVRQKAEDNRRKYGETMEQFIGDIVMSPNVEGKLFYEVSTTGGPKAAYAEFGTGAKVQIPAGWEDIAWQFYVDGTGTLAPHPYFIPAFNEVKAVYNADLIDALNKLVKKYNGSTR